MSNRFPKNVHDFLESYNGPYPLRQLRKARDTLIYRFNTRNSQTFIRLHKIMLMENFLNDLNCEYSEDNYCGSETESVTKLISPPKCNFSSPQDDFCSKPETSTISVAPQLEVSNSQEAVKKTFYSASGFRNRFAEYLMGKKSSSTTEMVANEKTLSNTKRKSSDMETDSFKNANMAETNNHSSPKKAKPGQMITGYKGDYCDFTSLFTSQTSEHLKNLKHQYASQCKGEMVDGNFSAQFTVGQSSLQCSEKPRTKVATCPSCCLTFQNIYECATHHVFCSGNSFLKQQELTYGLSDIVHETEISVPVDSVCQACQLKCSKHKALNLHYEACQHYPFKSPQSSVLLAFVCQICRKHFPGFFLAKSHAISHVSKREFRVLELIYYQAIPVEYTLVPSKLLSQKKKKKEYVYWKKKKVKPKNNSIPITGSSHAKNNS